MNSISIDKNGMAQDAIYIASPNQDARPSDLPIELVVIHNISLPPREFGGGGVIKLFTNQLNPDDHPYYQSIYQNKVSSHFYIRREGGFIQFVPCTQRAWHAGVSQWQGRERCNDFSIGIELEGSDFEPFEDAQYLLLNNLLEALRATYSIQAVVGHSDIAPNRKTDPGPYFDWARIVS